MFEFLNVTQKKNFFAEIANQYAKSGTFAWSKNPLPATPAQAQGSIKDKLDFAKQFQDSETEQEERAQESETVDYTRRFTYHTSPRVEAASEKDMQFIRDCFEYIGCPVDILSASRNMLCERYEIKSKDFDAASILKQRRKMTGLCNVSVTMQETNRGTVLLTVPFEKPARIHFGDVLIYGDFEDKRLPLCIGYDMDGQPIVEDLARLPHLLVAGQTGAGKSILLHNLICSLLLESDAELYLCDPKVVEMVYYKPLKRVHLVTETSHTVDLLGNLCKEMDRRYNTLCSAGCRDIDSYNEKGGEMKRKVLVVDELADLMEGTAPQLKRKICSHLQRLGQKARACGIHMILCTQSPRKECLPGIIKANIPAKICLKVSNQTESRVVLDNVGAEKLAGKGRFLFQLGDRFECQGGLITETEIHNVVCIAKRRETEER